MVAGTSEGQASKQPSWGKNCSIWRAYSLSFTTGGIFSVLSLQNKNKSRDSGCPLSFPVTHLSVWLSVYLPSGCKLGILGGNSFLPVWFSLGRAWGILELGSEVYVLVGGMHTPQKFEDVLLSGGKYLGPGGMNKADPGLSSVKSGTALGCMGGENGVGSCRPSLATVSESLPPPLRRNL